MRLFKWSVCMAVLSQHVTALCCQCVIYHMYSVIGEPTVEITRCNTGLSRPCRDDIIRIDDYFELTISLTCDISDPLATVYWYKNGEDFSAHSDGSVLRYTGNDPDDLLGVYQCFAETPAGVGYDTIRVIRAGKVSLSFPLSLSHTHSLTHSLTHWLKYRLIL